MSSGFNSRVQASDRCVKDFGQLTRGDIERCDLPPSLLYWHSYVLAYGVFLTANEIGNDQICHLWRSLNHQACIPQRSPTSPLLSILECRLARTKDQNSRRGTGRGTELVI